MQGSKACWTLPWLQSKAASKVKLMSTTSLSEIAVRQSWLAELPSNLISHPWFSHRVFHSFWQGELRNYTLSEYHLFLAPWTDLFLEPCFEISPGAGGQINWSFELLAQSLFNPPLAPNNSWWVSVHLDPGISSLQGNDHILIYKSITTVWVDQSVYLLGKPYTYKFPRQIETP